MKAKLMLCLCLCCIAIAAGCTIDYWNYAKFIVINNSSHKIRLIAESSEIYGNGKTDITIMPFEKSESKWIVDEAVGLENYIGKEVHATFDDEIEFTYQYSNTIWTNNICRYSYWDVNWIRKYKRKCTFTFTDEDYDRAVAANKESEE